MNSISPSSSTKMDTSEEPVFLQKEISDLKSTLLTTLEKVSLMFCMLNIDIASLERRKAAIHANFLNYGETLLRSPEFGRFVERKKILDDNIIPMKILGRGYSLILLSLQKKARASSSCKNEDEILQEADQWKKYAEFALSLGPRYNSLKENSEEMHKIVSLLEQQIDKQKEKVNQLIKQRQLTLSPKPNRIA